VSGIYCATDFFLNFNYFNCTVKSLFVGDEPVVFTLNGEDDAIWMIETEFDRILFLSLDIIGENIAANHLKNYLTV